MKGWRRPRNVISLSLAVVSLTLGLPASPAAAAPTPSSPITYVYDELGRLEAVVDPTAPTNGIAKYAYDDVGNVTSITRQSATSTTIIDFHPKTGEVGSSVTIYGAAFSSTPGQNTVKFGGSNGVAATVTSATTTRLVATVPSGAPTGPIYVSTANGAATSTQTFTVVGSKAPTITSFSPTTATPGNPVTVTGTNFDTTSAASNSVVINDLRAQVTAVTATSLTITVPPSATSGPVIVRNLNGAATSASDLTVPPSGYATTDIESTSRATVGQAKTASVSTSGKVALVLFDASQDQQVFLDISSSTMSSVTLKLYDPFGRSLGQTTVGTGGGYIDTLALPVDGTYSLVVDPAGTNTGSVTFTATDATPQAGTITPGGSSVPVTLSAAGQTAKLSFTAAAGQKVSLQYTSSTFPCCGEVKIVDRYGTSLGSALLGSSTGFIDTVTLEQAGTYWVVVDPNARNTGSLTLTLYDVVDATATITPGGSPVTATTTVPGQNAVFSFTGSANQRVSIDTTMPSTCCYGITVKDPNGAVLRQVSVLAGSDFVDTVSLSQAGTHTILVDPDKTQTGALTLKLYDVPPDPTGTLSIGGPSLTLTTTTPGQNFSATFSGSTAQQVNLTVNISYSGCCTNVVIKNPDGSQLVSQSVLSGQTVIGPVTLAQSGTHTIAVDPTTPSADNKFGDVTHPRAGRGVGPDPAGSRG